jgi:hypothetical protein
MGYVRFHLVHSILSVSATNTVVIPNPNLDNFMKDKCKSAKLT